MRHPARHRQSTHIDVRDVLDHAHKVVGIGERERLEQDRVHHAVDDRRGADAKSAR